MNEPMAETLTLTTPDDWHVHLRDGAVLSAVAAVATPFRRQIVMPNLVPPVVSAADVTAYRGRIDAAMAAAGTAFEPQMTLYLTNETTPAVIDEAAAHIRAVKLYPANATTNSAAGVTDIAALDATFERMAERGIPLLVHGEVTHPDVDIFDREAVFLDTVLEPLRRRVPQLCVVLEHVSSKTGADYVRAGGAAGLAGTITAHHLVIDRNDLLVGGIRPHRYCLPIVKRREDREALVAAATSGESAIFFGSDSAPHTDPNKLGACGAAGCFTAPTALAILAHVFEDAGALDRLERFAATNGAAFYGVAPNDGTVTLTKGPPYALPPLSTADGPIAVFHPPFPLTWRVA